MALELSLETKVRPAAPSGAVCTHERRIISLILQMNITVLVLRMAHRVWRETKQQPGTAGPGNMLDCCLVSFHFLSTILSTSTVLNY